MTVTAQICGFMKYDHIGDHLLGAAQLTLHNDHNIAA